MARRPSWPSRGPDPRQPPTPLLGGPPPLRHGHSRPNGLYPTLRISSPSVLVSRAGNAAYGQVVLFSDTIVLRHGDPDRALAGVRLVQEVGLADDLEFEYDDADRAWRLHLPPVPVWRLEYLLELRHNGHNEVMCDPANPQRAPGGYGEKS